MCPPRLAVILVVDSSDSAHASPFAVPELQEKINLKGKMPMDIGLSFLPRSQGGLPSKQVAYMLVKLMSVPWYSPGHEYRRDRLEDTPIHTLSVLFGKFASMLSCLCLTR